MQDREQSTDLINKLRPPSKEKGSPAIFGAEEGDLLLCLYPTFMSSASFFKTGAPPAGIRQ